MTKEIPLSLDGGFLNLSLSYEFVVKSLPSLLMKFIIEGMSD